MQLTRPTFLVFERAEGSVFFTTAGGAGRFLVLALAAGVEGEDDVDPGRRSAQPPPYSTATTRRAPRMRSAVRSGRSPNS